MSSLFSNPLFSLSGQKERLTNVKETYSVVGQNILNTITLGNVPSAGRISSNLTGTKGKAVEFVANNPLTTAGLIAGGGAIKTTATKAFQSAGVVTKGATFLGAGVLASSATAREATVYTASQLTPESLVRSGGEIGKIIDNPSVSSLSTFAKNNPILTGAGAAVVTYGAGKGGLALASNLIGSNQDVNVQIKNDKQTAPEDLTGFQKKQQKIDQELAEKQLKLQEDLQNAQIKLQQDQLNKQFVLEQQALAQQLQIAQLPKDEPVAITAPPKTVKKKPKKKAKPKKKTKPKPKKKAKPKPKKKAKPKKKTIKKRKR